MPPPHPTTSPARFLAGEIEALADIRDLPVTRPATRDLIRDQLARYTFDQPVALIDALGDVADLLRKWTLHATHPRYFGLFVPGVHEAGVWADALAALYNPQLGAWWHAPAASEVESHALAYLAGALGYDAACAHFTSGGSEANLTALLAAVTKAWPETPRLGVATAACRNAVYLSPEAHHSMQKAVRIAGLGDQALRVVPCNTSHQMDVEALRERIAMDAAAGYRALMVVATAGTTTAGAVDDLQTLGSVARASLAWFHVDAAWGGVAAFAPSLGGLLDGIEHADSVTWDAHKSLSVPMGAGMYFSRHAGLLARVFGVETGYVPKDESQPDDLYLTSTQWSRRFIGLKVFLTLAVLGRPGIAARIERQLEVADHLRTRLMAAGWELRNDSPLPVVCFTHPALRSEGAVRRVAGRIASRGRAWISCATLRGEPVLRACVTNDQTVAADVDVLFDELQSSLGA